MNAAIKYAIRGIGTTIGRPQTMTACRCNAKLARDDRPSRKAESSSCGVWGCPLGLTPCCRCCSYVNPEEAADVAAGSTSAASAAEALSPAADAASPLRPASNRTVAANWYQRANLRACTRKRCWLLLPLAAAGNTNAVFLKALETRPQKWSQIRHQKEGHKSCRRTVHLELLWP